MFTRLCFLLIEVPLELIVSVIFLGVYIDPVAIIGAAAIFIFVPIVVICATIMQRYIKRLAPIRDQRS